MEEPFVPSVKPIGMSDEQFEEEVRVAQDLHDLWLYKQNFKPMISEQEQLDEYLLYETLKEKMEQSSYKNWHV